VPEDCRQLAYEPPRTLTRNNQYVAAARGGGTHTSQRSLSNTFVNVSHFHFSFLRSLLSRSVLLIRVCCSCFLLHTNIILKSRHLLEGCVFRCKCPPCVGVVDEGTGLWWLEPLSNFPPPVERGQNRPASARAGRERRESRSGTPREGERRERGNAEREGTPREGERRERGNTERGPTPKNRSRVEKEAATIYGGSLLTKNRKKVKSKTTGPIIYPETLSDFIFPLYYLTF